MHFYLIAFNCKRMNRRKFIQFTILGGLSFLFTFNVKSLYSPKIKAIEHIRHGMLNFDMEHPNTIKFENHTYRLDQFYANGYSADNYKDLFVLTICKNKNKVQHFFGGIKELREYCLKKFKIVVY